MPVTIHPVSKAPAPEGEPVREFKEFSVEGMEVKIMYLNGVPVSMKLQADYTRVTEFHKALDGYLNTRPDAPDWLTAVSDMLSGVPARMSRPEVKK